MISLSLETSDAAPKPTLVAERRCPLRPNGKVDPEHRLPDQKPLNPEFGHGQPKLGGGDDEHTPIIRSYSMPPLAGFPAALTRTAFP